MHVYESIVPGFGVSGKIIRVRFISVGEWATLPQVAIFDTKTLGF